MTTFSDYVEFWDEFVRNWFERIKGLPISPMKWRMDIYNLYKDLCPYFGNGSHHLESNELPEPYLIHFPSLSKKNEDKVKVVVFNLNPGGTATWNPIVAGDIHSDDDSTKMINPWGGPDGALLNEYSGTYYKIYSSYIQDYSPITCGDIVGSNWWLNTTNRIPWLRQFYAYVNKKGLRDEEIWGVELCPFHSLKFDKTILNQKKCSTLYDINVDVLHIIEDTIDKHNKKGGDRSFGVAFSKEVYDFLLRNGYSVVPIKHPSFPTKRQMHLLKHSSKDVTILCTWYRGGFISPGNNFRKIEKKIAKYI